MHESDPICGDCGNPKSKHLTKRGRSALFCNADTTGNLFTDEPTQEAILELLEELFPGTEERLDLLWKRNNGHITTEEMHQARIAGIERQTKTTERG